MSDKLPKGWVECKLGEVGLPTTKKINPSRFTDKIFELWSVPNYPNDEPEYLIGNEIKSSKQIVQEKDILLCKINPRINRVWIVRNKNSDLEQIASTEWIVIRNKKLNSIFIRFYLTSPNFRKKLCSELSGVGGSLTRARPKNVKALPIPLPPLNEQKRIVEKIEALENRKKHAKDALERIMPLCGKFRQSLLASAFNGVLTEKWRRSNQGLESAEKLLARIRVERREKWEEIELSKMALKNKMPKNAIWKDKYISPKKADSQNLPGLPQGWCWARLEEVCEFNPKHDKKISDDTLVSFIPMANVDIEKGIVKKEQTKLLKDVRKGYTHFADNDIIWAKITPCMENGKAAVAKNLVNGLGCGSTEFYVIRLMSNLFKKLFYYFIWQEKYRQDAKMHMTGAVGHARVPKDYLLNTLIPLPPLEEQKQIVKLIEERLAKNEAIKNKCQSMLAALEKLGQSILTKAFKGELVVQDPNDEPAEKLLERIRGNK